MQVVSNLSTSEMFKLTVKLSFLLSSISITCSTEPSSLFNPGVGSLELDIFMIVTEWSSLRQTQLINCMRTMQVKLDPPLDVHFHILVDSTSASQVLNVVNQTWCSSETHCVKVSLYNIDHIQETILPYHSSMMKHFSSENNLYYNRTIFFVEAVLHKILPNVVKKVLVFDIDIKFNSSVGKLYAYFEQFLPSNLLGLAYEQQPTYMHYTSVYRSNNPSTRIGSPPPYGYPGLNSGVILMNLEKLRGSVIYDQFMLPINLQQISDKYSFQGNLGDQDYFTLLFFEHPELFYVLPCTWNRQLCRWFESHGYYEQFDSFHMCQGDINIFHGNCNSTLPEL